MWDVDDVTGMAHTGTSIMPHEDVVMTTPHADMAAVTHPAAWTSALNSTELGEAATPPVFWEYTLSLQIQAYAGALIVLFGVFGNSLCIATLSQGRVNSTSIYLINLAISDLTVTVVGQLCRVFPRALTGFDTGSFDPWICKTWFFINHSAKTISGWTLVAVTVERVLVVFMPLKVKGICTNRKAKICVAVVNVLCIACYLHYFWSYGAVYEEQDGVMVKVAGCTILKDNPDLVPYMLYVRPWQDFVVRSAAPFACLILSNCLIIGKLLHESRRRQKMAQGKHQQDDSRMRSMTAMLLTVSFAHLVCISPMQIMYLVDKSDPFGWKIEHRWQALVALRWSFAIDMYYANHAINFILYCISGSEFRGNVAAMFRKALGRKAGGGKGHERDSYTGNTNLSTVSQSLEGKNDLTDGVV